MIKSKIKKLPKKPAVYIFKDKFNNIIYIGKAKNLKNRVSSYFNSNSNHSIKTQFLIKNITDLDYIIVDNEIEALLLENKLIKKNKPKYNINLKDSKTYAYLKITDEKIPKIVLTRKIKKDGTYFGPYSNATLRREIFNLVIELFQIISKKTYSSKSKLNYQIGLAPAPTIDEIELNKYLEKVEQAKQFLKGDTTKILKKLKTQMQKASNELKYEIAAQKKNQILAIEHLKEKQKVDLIKGYDQDIIALIKDEKQNTIIELFNISKGVITGRKDFKFEYDENLFEEFIKMYYSQNNIPQEIILNEEFWENEENKIILEKYLSKNKGSKVTLNYPKKGEKRELVLLAEKNAKIKIEGKNILVKIQEMLNLKKTPNLIECFDISNLSYDYIVGAMVQFKDAKPNKENYRKYEIKSFNGKNDDYKAIQEVIFRRYNKLKNENLNFPDLIIIDGGLGQLRAAIKSLQKINLKIPIISLAKKDEEIFIENKTESLKFDKNCEEMLFIRNIRDTTHNFVISYNRKKRDMKIKKEFKK